MMNKALLVALPIGNGWVSSIVPYP